MIKIGTSACVVGDKVRFDGGHKRSAFVAGHIVTHYELVKFCPEVGIGMPVPRPAIQLREVDERIRLVDSKTGEKDYSDAMAGYFSRQLERLQELDGYILAAKSPSCGMERIKIHNEDGKLLHRDGVGMFAAALKQAFPDLPVEEDGRLNDQGLRESFFTRVEAYARFRQLVLENMQPSSLIEFHTCYKYLLLAYNPKIYYELGPVVANCRQDFDAAVAAYRSKFMQALSKPTTRKKHTNVLMHLQGFFKQELDSKYKSELTEEIKKYHSGYVPLLAPLTLINHYLREFPNEFLAKQAYLNPYPLELGLMA
ncbi:YbgA family protein [Planctobacterium marinum]|uniref:YbgA family protein n=1 Tax=Planctobacterium marinum TaxID=1631968 RepID=UPI001E43730D|nr:DUF523 and DUF1722 domain-containing protein [Planctobacterium marinum]MCC2604399.1 DUF523 and DUF1722 domain-containing protein [Planctobacterium marinum]